jgi:parvulin-like peptidyl-prolyl isomerase
MKKVVIFTCLVLLVVSACSSKKESVAIKAGTPAYQLAKDLTAIIPYLDPDKNNVLVSTSRFEITTGEVLQSIQDNVGTRASELKDLPPDQLKNAIVQSAMQLAERKLLLGAAGEAKSSVSPEEITKAMNDEYSRAGGESKFLELLKTSDISIDYVKSSIQAELTIQKFLDGLFSAQAQVAEDDLKKAYEADKTASVRHILLLTQGKTDKEKTEIHKKMEEILARAKAGEDFAELAKKYTEDAGSKDNGGLYENFGRGKMVKPFEDASFSVPVGEISNIVETTYGYHIIKVIDRKKEAQPFDQVKSQLETDLKQQKSVEVYQDLMSKLKNKARFQLASF